MKFPSGHDSPFLFSPFYSIFKKMNCHTLTARKVLQNHQCDQVLFFL